MTSAPAKFVASAALAAAVVLGGASGALAQENGSNGSNGSGNAPTTTVTPTTAPPVTIGDTGGSSLPNTGGDALLTLGGAGALLGLAYGARRAAQNRI